MFNKARLKLTAWYLLIVMLISISFSIAIYNVLTNELNRVERVQRLRQKGQLSQFREAPPRPFMIDPQLIEETKNRLKIIFLAINLGILGFSGLAGYFLAGRTLRPIKEMVDEQNRFITDASHELRTPLTSLRSEIEVNLRDKNLTMEDAKKLLASNLEEVNNLQSLSDNLIKLTQYQESNGNMVFERVSLSEVAREACRKIASLAKYKNVIVDNRIGNQIVEGDKQSLIELLVILLDNAVKYSGKGKVVTLESELTDQSIILEVKDQGVGIDESDIVHLFDRFYRADRSRSKVKVTGYGLGLSIAKQIVLEHNGSIKVESEVNKGSKFTVVLPSRH